MRSKLVRSDFGKIEALVSISLLLVFFFNIFDQVSKGQNIIHRAYLTIPFLVLGIALIFINKRYVYSAIFLYIAIGTTIDPSNISDFSGAIFFIFSFHMFKNYIYGYLLIAISIIMLTIRSVAACDTIPGALIVILAYLSIYTLYYFIIYKDHDKMVIVKFKALTKEENKILTYMANGLSQKEAGYELGYDKFKTNYLVKEIRKKTGYNSLYEILYRAGLKEYSTSSDNK
jgi:DNA-binding CsgD family transcriptional regulator